MRYRMMGTDPKTRREVSVISLGAMLMGTLTDEATSFAVLDRYAEAGGTFIDTSNNYAFWVEGSQGGESEQLLGRWRRSRGVGDEIVIATKLGARPNSPATGDRGDRQSGGPGLAHRRRGPGRPAGRRLLGGAAGREPRGGGPGADGGAAGDAGRRPLTTRTMYAATMAAYDGVCTDPV